MLSKSLVCFLIVLGVFTFNLPASIIGTSLSIKIHKDYRKSIKYLHAVRLIQTYWRCQACETNAGQKLIQAKMSQFTNSSLSWRVKRRTLTYRDYMCLRFVNNVKYLMALSQLEPKLKLTTHDELSHHDAELWKRVEYIENDLSALSSAINFTLNERLPKLQILLTNIQQDLKN